jgi:hypothetical protein
MTTPLNHTHLVAAACCLLLVATLPGYEIDKDEEPAEDDEWETEADFVVRGTLPASNRAQMNSTHDVTHSHDRSDLHLASPLTSTSPHPPPPLPPT